MNPKHFSPIGIDFDYNEFRAVQLNTSSHDRPITTAVTTLARKGSRKLVPSTDELNQFAQLLAQRGFVGNKVAIGVPKEHSSFHILELPPKGSGAPINQLALLEAQRSGAHKTKDLQIGYWTQPPKNPPSKFPSPYYTVACETEPLDELIDQFESANLLPISVEPIETALVRTASSHSEFEQDAINCILEFGWDHSWAVITVGSTPVYTRKIDLGASRVRRQLIDDHAMPIHAINTLLNPTESLLNNESKVGRILSALLTPLLSQMMDQLDTALTYVSQQHRFAPFGIVLRSGYYAHLDQFAYATAQRTGMPTLMLSPNPESSDSFYEPITQFEYKCSPRINIATGLAKGAAA
jgi:Tfp pilus assembly PilM family ATPase